MHECQQTMNFATLIYLLPTHSPLCLTYSTFLNDLEKMRLVSEILDIKKSNTPQIMKTKKMLALRESQSFSLIDCHLLCIYYYICSVIYLSPFQYKLWAWTTDKWSRGEFALISHRNVTACDAWQFCMSPILANKI